MDNKYFVYSGLFILALIFVCGFVFSNSQAITGFLVYDNTVTISGCSPITIRQASTKVLVSKNLQCDNTPILIDASNVLVDCDGHWIRGSGSSTGIQIGKRSGVSDVTVKNCKLSNWDRGIMVYETDSSFDSGLRKLVNPTENIHIENVESINNDFTGITFWRVDGGSITKSKLSGNDEGGLKLYQSLNLKIGENIEGTNEFTGNTKYDVECAYPDRFYENMNVGGNNNKINSVSYYCRGPVWPVICANDNECDGKNPYCDVNTGKCVACVNDDNCDGGVCVNNQCSQCGKDEDCEGDDICDGNYCVPAPVCGNKITERGEECDDGNSKDDDGCKNCQITPGWECEAEAGVEKCKPICGNLAIHGDEACDDGNTEDGDGCSSDCSIEDGWRRGASKMLTICGDGKILGSEACDDGTRTGLGGCSSDCTFVHDGWTCVGEPSSCFSCGNKQIENPDFEECDDGNNEDGDGCSADCMLEQELIGALTSCPDSEYFGETKECDTDADCEAGLKCIICQCVDAHEAPDTECNEFMESRLVVVETEPGSASVFRPGHNCEWYNLKNSFVGTEIITFLDYIVDDALDCCESPQQTVSKYHQKYCEDAHLYTPQTTKDCITRFITSGLQDGYSHGSSKDNEVLWITNYYYPEACCDGNDLCSSIAGGVKNECSPNSIDGIEFNDYVKSLTCEDTDCNFVDQSAFKTAAIINSGTCTDWSILTTSLLRKSGYHTFEDVFDINQFSFTSNAPFVVGTSYHSFNLVWMDNLEKYVVVNYGSIITTPQDAWYDFCGGIIILSNDKGEEVVDADWVSANVYGCGGN